MTYIGRLSPLVLILAVAYITIRYVVTSCRALAINAKFWPQSCTALAPHGSNPCNNMYEAGAKSKGEGSHIRMLQCLYHQYGKTFWAIVLGERGHLYRRCREHSGNIYDPVPEIDPALHYGILSWKAYNLPESSHVALLDALREDVLRNADDTPRHTATTKDPVSGISQQRACEDWNKFKAWAMQFGGLWRYLSAAADQRSESERRMYYEPVCLYSVRIQGWVGKYGSTSET